MLSQIRFSSTCVSLNMYSQCFYKTLVALRIICSQYLAQQIKLTLLIINGQLLLSKRVLQWYSVLLYTLKKISFSAFSLNCVSIIVTILL